MRAWFAVLMAMLISTPVMAQNQVVNMPHLFGFTIPEGWDQVSEEELAALNYMAQTDSPLSEFVYIDAYSPTGSMQSMPYMLIQFNKQGYRGATVGDISEVFGAEVLEEVIDTLPEDLTTHIESVTVGGGVLDLDRSRVLIRADAETSGVMMDITMFVFLGLDETIQFNFYAAEGTGEIHNAVFEEMSDSFHYRGKNQWSPDQGGRKAGAGGAAAGNNIVRYAIFGGIAGLVGGLMISVFRKKNG
jgi:hypothetical protein